MSDGRGPGQAGFSTRSVHGGGQRGSAGDPVAMPIFQTSTFLSDYSPGAEVLYTRYGNNPNQRALEQRIGGLEGAEDCVVTGSGMAAMTCALLAVLESGDRLVASRALYGGTRALLDRELPRLGITTSYLDLDEPGWEQQIGDGASALLVEMPTNPLLRVYDLPAITRIAREKGIPVLVDSTFASPVNLRPLEHGADLVVHSATKYLGGHSDVTAGAVAGSAELAAMVRERARILGPALDPHAAWLVERGIKTLAVRMERHNRNGAAVAEWASGQSRIKRVFYPGLGNGPQAELARRLLDGFGGMIGFEIEGGIPAATRFVGALRLATVAVSLGGVETLVSEPRLTSHAALSTEERAAQGINDGFVRFSLGIEDAADLIADFEQALRVIGTEDG